MFFIGSLSVSMPGFFGAPSSSLLFRQPSFEPPFFKKTPNERAKRISLTLSRGPHARALAYVCTKLEALDRLDSSENKSVLTRYVHAINHERRVEVEPMV
jgi:hypothetical protein